VRQFYWRQILREDLGAWAKRNLPQRWVRWLIERKYRGEGNPTASRKHLLINSLGGGGAESLNITLAKYLQVEDILLLEDMIEYPTEGVTVKVLTKAGSSRIGPGLRD
jgi:hypothetical protein